MIGQQVQQIKSIKIETIIQFIKYALAGGLATLVHIIIFHICAWRFFPSLQEQDLAVRLLGLSVVEVDIATRSVNSMLSNGVAFVCSNLTAYLMNIFWVFEPGRHNRIVEIGLFYLVSGVSIVIGTALMGMLIRVYGMQTTYAFGANIISSVLINYVMRKFFIFKG